MKLTCIKKYRDKKQRRIVEPGEIISASRNRANELINAGVAEIVEDPEEVEGDGEA